MKKTELKNLILLPCLVPNLPLLHKVKILKNVSGLGYPEIYFSESIKKNNTMTRSFHRKKEGRLKKVRWLCTDESGPVSHPIQGDKK
jgi:hypothetical protein